MPEITNPIISINTQGELVGIAQGPILQSGTFSSPSITVNNQGLLSSISNGGTGGVAASVIVFLIAGQSNAVAYGGGAADPFLDYTNPRILQIATNETNATSPPGPNTFQYLKQIGLASQPLINNDSNYANNTLEGFGWHIPFAQEYSRANPNAIIILINSAYGGSTLDNWFTPGQPAYTGVNTYTIPTNANSPSASVNLGNRAVQYCNLAMATQILPGVTNKFGGILWLQGESDSGTFPSYLGYLRTPLYMQRGLADLIQYFRTGITGASSTTPFVCGQLNSNGFISIGQEFPTGPAVNTFNDVSGLTNEQLLNQAFATIGSSIAYTGCALNAGILSIAGTGHYPAPACRAYGSIFYQAYVTALTNSNPSSPVLPSSGIPTVAPTVTIVNNNTSAPYLTWADVPNATEYVLTCPTQNIPLIQGAAYATNVPQSHTYIANSSMGAPSGILQFTSGTQPITVKAQNVYGLGPGTTVSVSYGSGGLPGAFTSSITTQTLNLLSTPSPAATSYTLLINGMTVSGISPGAFPYVISNATFGLTPATSYPAVLTAVNASGSTPSSSNGGGGMTFASSSGGIPGAFTSSITSQTLSLLSTPSPAALSYTLVINSVTVSGILPSAFPYVISNGPFGLTPSTSYPAALTAVNGSGSTASSSNGGGGMTFTSNAVTPFLDTYPGASAAYSLRQLGTYPKCLQVLHSSTPTDVGFNSDGTPNFTGVTTGDTILTWYDQSGNSNHLTTTTNSTITLTTTGSTASYNTPGIIYTDDGSTAKTLVGNMVVPTVASVFFVLQNTAGYYMLSGPSNSPSLNYSGNQSTMQSTNVNGTTCSTWEIGTANLSSIGICQTGVATTSTYTVGVQPPYTCASLFGGASYAGGTYTNLGAQTPGSYFNTDWVGQFNELIIYPSNQQASVAAMCVNQNTYYGISTP